MSCIFVVFERLDLGGNLWVNIDKYFCVFERLDLDGNLWMNIVRYF